MLAATGGGLVLAVIGLRGTFGAVESTATAADQQRLLANGIA